MTVLEVIQRSTEYLAKRGVESPRLQTELLLAHVLKLPRLKLYLNFDRPLAESEVEATRTLVKRRGQREPLQHLTGSTSFCGYEILVGPQALIPRPETEVLAEQAWLWLAGRAAGPLSVLDFGTGTGCLAIALAVHVPAARVLALDVSAEALELARRNAVANQLGDRIEFLMSDGFAALPSGVQFDLIVTNPPYIASVEVGALEPEVRDYDPRLALDGGSDGLDFYRRLAAEGQRFLRARGRLMAEFGDDQAEAIRGLFEAQGWPVLELIPDLSGRLRLITAGAD